MTKTTILILGGGGMQVPAIKAAKEMGWTTIVADGVLDVPGRKYADHFEQVDLKDVKGMIEASFKYKNSIGLDGVFTAGTDFSETVARVAAAANLPGISIDASINASNKWKMRDAFRKANIPSPLFFTVSDDSPLNSESLDKKGVAFPLVVKPVDNMGSRGIRRTENYDQLQAAVKDAFRYSRSGTVIIEEYLDGAEFSIDALVYENEIIICGFADRNIFFPPYFVEMGHTIPSSADSKLYNEIITIFKAAVIALGITTGAAKGDIRLNKGKVFIGEIAARLSGGYMSGWTFPYSSGVSLTREALKIAVGLPPGSLVPLCKKTSAERAFLSIPGKIKIIDGLENTESDKNIKDLFLRVKPGDVVKFPENNVEKAGNYISVNEDRDKAVQSAEEACRKIFIRLEACHKNTEEFLFGSLQSWVEDAFVLKEKVNIETLENMPDFYFNSDNNTSVISSGISSVISLLALNLESGTDCQGKSIAGAFKEVLKKKYADQTVEAVSLNEMSSDKVESFKGSVVLGRLFYRAFLRGGVQGGVWVLDSILQTIKEKKSLLELFARWQEY